jgi:hypothetical protein
MAKTNQAADLSAARGPVGYPFLIQTFTGNIAFRAPSEGAHGAHLLSCQFQFSPATRGPKKKKTERNRSGLLVWFDHHEILRVPFLG